MKKDRAIRRINHKTFAVAIDAGQILLDDLVRTDRQSNEQIISSFYVVSTKTLIARSNLYENIMRNNPTQNLTKSNLFQWN